MDGSGSSDADGDSLSYQWSLTTVASGSNAALSDGAVASPSFTADLDGTYIAQLIVNDGTVSSAADTVTIVASTANSAPIANAGADQSVATNTVVNLDGSGSTDADGDSLSYQWSLTTVASGSNAALSDGAVASPSFTADLDGSYIAQLIVNDGTVSSAADTVTIVASTANSAPIANAGADQNVATNTVVNLDGSGSTDADGDSLSYQWSLTAVASGSNAALSDGTVASPSFTADLDGTYIAQLIVNDGTVSSAADTVTIVASTANSAPIADAGADQNVATATIVSLDGSGSSDADSDGLSYSWVFVSTPSGSAASFDNADVFNPTFTADLAGSYVIGLVVNDGFVDSGQDIVQIQAIQPSVTLYRKTSDILNPTFVEVPLPYSSNSSIVVNVTGIPAPTTYTLNTSVSFCGGQTFTITNVTATDTTALVTPYFDGLSDGHLLGNEEELTFDLVSPLTGGVPVQLQFSFEIAETGDTFVAAYMFTSN